MTEEEKKEEKPDLLMETLHEFKKEAKIWVGIMTFFLICFLVLVVLGSL